MQLPLQFTLTQHQPQRPLAVGMESLLLDLVPEVRVVGLSFRHKLFLLGRGQVVEKRANSPGVGRL